MIRKCVLSSSIALALAAGLALPAVAADTPDVPAGPNPPRLVVTVVVDQLSSNLFNQYRRHFTGGFKRLMDEGMVYANGFQTHGVTETCPGHSTVLTGKHPANTGISVNYSVDPATGEGRYCMASTVNTLAHGRVTDNGNVGTELLKADTLGDVLVRTSPASRIFAVSGKDRGAMNLAGHAGQAFWFTDGFGLTTYVRPGETAAQKLAAVAEFNKGYPAAEQGRRWHGTHAVCQALAEDVEVADGVYPSRVPPSRDSFSASPLYDEETLRAARYLLKSQGLGQGPAVDLLGVSLSGTDIIGHSFGTQGPEQCEQMMRLDAALGEFLDELDEVEGGVILALTADHGGSDINERTARRGFPHMGRVNLDIMAETNAALRQQFGLDHDPLQRGASGLRITDANKVSLPEPLRSQIAAVAVEKLRQGKDLAFVEFIDTLLAEPLADSLDPQSLTVRERMRLSAVKGVSADIMMAFRPGLATGGRIGGNLSSHGQPWDYDRGVPIIFWAPEGRGQERFMPVRTIDIAPTLANVIGVGLPGVDGRCMSLDLAGARACPAE